MKTLSIVFFVGACCFLSACEVANNLEKHMRGEETVSSLLVRTDSGEVYFFDEEIDRLIENINSQLELSDLGATTEAVISRNLGFSHLEQGELDKAIVEFKKAVQAYPGFIEAHYLLADVYSLKGEGVLSRKSLETAMALEGSYIIDTTIGAIDRSHTIIEPIPFAVIESDGSIIHIFPPEFFEEDVPRRWKPLPK